MPDVMSTGLSALRAFQRQLDTASHNIANVSTPGYSRQRVELGTRPASPLGNGWVGNGVSVQAVRRQIDEFLVSQSRAGASAAESLRSYAGLSERLGNLLGDVEGGITATLQRFNDALQNLTTAPGSIAARQAVLGEAQSAVDRLRYFDSRLRDLDRETDSRVRAEIAEVNSIAEGLARLNRDIASGQASTGQPPNDLLDERDRLLDRLAARINVQIVPQDGGVVNVFVGRGQALVLNQSAARLSTQPDAFDPSRSRVVFTNAQGTTDVTRAVTGGTLGGLLDVRREVLDPTRHELGRIAAGFADALNAQHVRGMDLRGALGGVLFATGGVTAEPARDNSGAASVSATRIDASALTGYDYEMQFDGSSWTLRRLDSGAVVPLTGSGTSADPFRAEGLAIVVSGAAQAGDRYALRPTRDVINGLQLAIADPARLAVASPIAAGAAATNTGSAALTALAAVDPSDPALRSTAVIEITGPGTYSVNGAGSFSYVPGQPIQVNGWTAVLTEGAAVGDRFTVRDNAGATGDNRNARALAESLDARRFDGGSSSVSDLSSRLVSGLGVTTRQAQINRDAQDLLYREATTQRQNASGVNLDEEAANLLRFQQAYQAAAQLIRVANDMFNALLNATR